MDNIGVGGGNAGENRGIFGVPENTPNPMGEVPNFEEFLKEREDLKPQMEAPGEIIESAESSVGEKASEQISSAMPVAKPAVSDVKKAIIDADPEPVSAPSAASNVSDNTAKAKAAAPSQAPATVMPSGTVL